MFLGKGILKICSKFIGEHSRRSMISIKLLCFIEITLRHGCSPVNLLHIFRTSFLKNASGWLLLILSKANWRILTIVSMSVVFCRRCLIGLNLKILLFIFCVVTQKGTLISVDLSFYPILTLISNHPCHQSSRHLKIS